MFKLSRKTSLIIVSCIGVLYILYGIALALFKFKVNEEISRNVSFVVLMIAVVLFVNGRNAVKKPSDTGEAGVKEQQNGEVQDPGNNENKQQQEQDSQR